MAAWRACASSARRSEAVHPAELAALPDDTLRATLTACCGARPWVEGLIASRPWSDAGALMDAADRAWAALSPQQVAEAIAHHPRLGERRAAVALDARASGWSAGEQSGAAAADEATRAALAAGNAEYEQRFGHVFILCASGLDAAQMLAALRARLTNDAATEQTITARELHRITRLRLEKLLASDAPRTETP